MGVLQGTQAKVFNVTNQFVSFHYKKNYCILGHEKKNEYEKRKMKMLTSAGVPNFLLTLHCFASTFLVSILKKK